MGLRGMMTPPSTELRDEGGARPDAWAKARVIAPGSRVGNSKLKRKGSPGAAPSVLPVREAPTYSYPVLEQPVSIFNSR